MSPTILAIETATEACSAALLHNDHLYERYELAPQKHNSLILPMCEELMRQANINFTQINALAFGCGPGSFTGLRIAAGIIQGFAFAHQLPVIPISTLRVLAQELNRKNGAKKVLASLDARVNEIYWGEYQLDDSNLMQACHAELLVKPENISLPENNNWVGAGSAWTVYGETLKNILGNKLERIVPDVYPTAAAVILCAQQDYLAGKFVTAEKALPVYLRDKIVK
jgi:tRNA threonylcarbamoyladenosine biosynthesis protein TsaB